MAESTGDFSTERWSYYMEVTWKLRDFLRLSKVSWGLNSPWFSLARADWGLVLYPNVGSGGKISIYLRRAKFSDARQRVKTTFSLKYRDGKDSRSHNCDTSYEQNSNFHSIGYLIPRSQLECVHEKDSLLPDGTLTIHCHIRVEPSPDDSGTPKSESSETDSNAERVGTVASPRQHLDASSQTESPDACQGAADLTRTSPSVQKLQSDYKKLLESKEEADVRLKVSDKEFRAHKCILRARSSVFSAMFKPDTRENNSGEVVIEDLDPESFPDFLQHVYAGSVDTLSEENVFNLYTAADKYDMADLKAECKSFMERTLSVDTFCDVMILALRYKEDELLKVAVDFFSKNLTRIIVTVKWQKFLKEYDTAANELLIKALVPADQM